MIGEFVHIELGAESAYAYIRCPHPDARGLLQRADGDRVCGALVIAFAGTASKECHRCAEWVTIPERVVQVLATIDKRERDEGRARG